jgi:hypothetical protein
MTRPHVTISLLCLVATVACTDVRTRRAADSDTRPVDAQPSTAIVSPWIASGYRAPAVGRRFDIRGNAIEHAVGEYRIDPYGEPYDVHAPETELPALGPAGT